MQFDFATCNTFWMLLLAWLLLLLLVRCFCSARPLKSLRAAELLIVRRFCSQDVVVLCGRRRRDDGDADDE